MFRWLGRQHDRSPGAGSICEPLRDGRMLLLRPFEMAWAGMVANWLRDHRDAYWAAPRSPRPFSAATVQNWVDQASHALLGWVEGSSHPCVYGELNHFHLSGGESWLGHLAVDPARRGRGIGVAFCRALARLAFDEHNRRILSLVVFPENHGAIACYARAGFVHTGSQFSKLPGAVTEVELLRMEVRPRRAKLDSAAKPTIAAKPGAASKPGAAAARVTPTATTSGHPLQTPPADRGRRPT